MDNKLCSMIVQYCSKLKEEGINVMADAAQENVDA